MPLSLRKRHPVADQKSDAPVVAVDKRGFVYADGVQIGKLTHDRKAIQIVDRDRGRSQVRGTRIVTVPLTELGKLSETK